VLSRAAVNEKLRHPEIYSSDGVIMIGNVRPLIPLGVDPPKHVRYRKIMDPPFAPKRMDAIEDDISRRFNNLIDTFIDRRECEFHDEVAVPFPSSIFVGLMGLPESELETLLRFKDGILRSSNDLPPDTPPELMMDAMRERQRRTGQEIYAYFTEAIRERQMQPRVDIITMFMKHEVDGQKLSEEEILDTLFLFLIAGLDTVTDSLSCLWNFLATNPDHRHQIVDNPSVIPSAVEELLRWETPVPGVTRRATTDTELGGVSVKAGDMIRVSLAAANIDEDETADAHEVRFDRDVNRHIAFGGGVHRCLGSHLARRELRVAMREWHRRIPEYELREPDERQWPIGLRSVTNLWLRW
jgi:cytochrome P450